MTCPDIMELEQFVLRDLDDAAMTRTREHLIACGKCRDEVTDLQRNLELVPSLRRSPFGHDPDGSVDLLEAQPRRDDQEIGATADVEPAVVGPYRVIRRIGQGGMGAVYEAEQENPRRTVALKMVRPGLISATLLARFRHEVQTLGRLRHPGIAQIYEAGTHRATFGPQPYFAMELVNGRSLIEYAEENSLTRHQRLELLARICDAVHHAHQRGVIHRDLKPQNILVDDSSGQPLPKILDFGVARVVDPTGQTTTLHTSAGQIIGTVAYMSPEQAGGDPSETDTRSDVYAVGVIAFELLARRLPYKLNPASVAESVRAIVQDEPSALSAADRSLRGDVTTIVGKALEKDRSRRYQSAAELAEDIRRFLRDEPILAHAPSAVYQFRKFARRNKGLVAGVGLAFALLVLGVIGTTLGMYRARQSAFVARGEADKAKAINSFLDRMLRSANPSAATTANSLAGRDVKVVQLLDDAATQLDSGGLGAQPAVEAAVRRTLASTYSALAEYSAAERQVRKSLEIHTTLHGNEHLEVASDLISLGIVLHSQGRLADAGQAYKRAMDIRRSIIPGASAELAEAINAYGAILKDQGKYAEAERVLSEALSMRRTTLGEEHKDVASTLNQMAVAQQKQGRNADAEQSMRRALALRRRLLSASHPELIVAVNDLAAILYMQGRAAEAEPLFREALEARIRTFGDSHPDVAESRIGLAVVLREQRKFADAEQMLRQSLEVQRRILGENNHDVAASMNNLGGVLRDQGKLAEAEEMYRASLRIDRQQLGPSHPVVASTMTNLASLLLAMKRYPEAESLLRESLAVHQQNPDSAASGRQALTEMYLGGCLIQLSRFSEAEQSLTSALAAFKRAGGDSDRRTVVATGYLILLYDEWGKPEKAAEYRASTQPTTRRVAVPPATQPGPVRA